MTLQMNNVPTSFVGEGAWHRLGNAIPEEQGKNFQYILEEGGLNYEAEKVQFKHPWATQLEENGIMVPDFEAYGTFRKDTAAFLGTVGKDYTVIQNAACFKFLEDILNEGYTVDSAGTLRGGAVAFANVLIGEQEPIKGDPHKFYAQFVTSHDGTLSLTFLETLRRIVCSNTMRYAIKLGKKSGKIFKVSHTKNAETKLENAKEFLTLLGGNTVAFGEKLKFLASKTMTVEMEKIFLDKLVGEVSEDENANKRRANMRDAILNAPDNSDIVKGISGTPYSMLQRVTNYYTHGADASKKDPMSLAVSSEFGSYATKKQEAFNILFDMVK